MNEEFDIMEERAHTFKEILRGWKVYTAWGDVANSTGWYFDDPIGEKFIAKVDEISRKIPTMPRNIAVHKGFALPGFDQRAASPRDVGPVARQYPHVNFIIYHSGYDGARQIAYPGDTKVNSSDRDVNALIKSLRENGIYAINFRKPWTKFGNIPNVYAEIGSTWRSVMNDPDEAAALLGKLITHVGPARILWGTDSLWFGSPQSEIIALRAFHFTPAGIKKYCPGLSSAGLDSDYEIPELSALDPNTYASTTVRRPDGFPRDRRAHPERTIRNAIFGRNAARVYSTLSGVIDPDAVRHKISCDDVQKIRDGYLLNQATPKEMVPLASNQVHGARTPGELIRERSKMPWGP
jgi:predicted TIM-barrel fold metal-dependent hydrolase